MNNHLYSTIVLVGDGIYADIATCYLANQLRPYGINLCRVRGFSTSDQQVTINVDHSIHVLNDELGIRFPELMSAGIFIPTLVRSVSFPEKNAYFESYTYLKDDLPIPPHQAMARLVREGVATQWESVSPLVALANAGKFHPELHQFYRGNVRPYGASVNIQAYSKILESKSLSFGVEFLNVSKIEIDAQANEQYIAALHLDTGAVLRDVFFIDMTPNRRLSGLIAKWETINSDAQLGFNYSTQPWSGNCLAMGEAAINFASAFLSTSVPVNSFEWLFKSLVRFIDFFPCVARQGVLAQEYNRLQKNDGAAIADFLQVYSALTLGSERKLLPEKLQHRVNLFAESCQLSEDASGWAYPGYWPVLMIAAGINPQYLPRRVQEIPLKYLIDWFNQRLHNIGIMVSRSYSL